MGLAAALLVMPAASEGGTTGKLSGRVADPKKQPLAGVNVAVPGARTGAVTTEDGRYVILNIPAGSYDVRFSLLGYRSTLVQHVQISADQTTPLDVALEEAPLQMEEVVVSARRPVVDLRLTSSLASVSRDEIRKLPVQELQDLVNLQAGVVNGHFRGGREGEVQYQVDGVTINDSYNNKSTLRLDRSLLEEVQVMSGTFDAEYGQAMSGVVNAVLRRGGEKFQWDGEAFTGDFVFARFSPFPVFESHSRRLVDDPFRPNTIQNYQLTVSGPTLLPKTFFFLSGRHYSFDDYVMARRYFQPTARYDSTFNAWILTPGDGEREALAFSREWSGAAKITNRSLRGIELNYEAILNRIEARPMKWNYRFEPDGVSRQHTLSLVHGVDWVHTLSGKMFYNLSVRQNYTAYRDMAYDDLHDPRYDAAANHLGIAGGPNDGALIAGVDFTRFERSSNALVLKSSLTSQFSRDALAKVGAEAQWPIIEFGNPGYLVFATVNGRQQLVRHENEPPNYPGVQRFRPFSGAAYSHGELEYNDLKVRAGLRLEYFDARAALPSDLANPANSISGAPPSPPRRVSAKARLAPRLGLSYPVTEDAVLYFSYGHFYQLPSMGDIFLNADYSVLSDLQAGVNEFSRVMGNPDIKPEKTVQYSFGYKQALTDWVGLDVCAFYKDVRDLLGVEFISTYNDAEYARLTNVDFGDVIGFTLSLNQRTRGMLSTHFDYTWQLAQGNSSDPRETATRAAAGADPRPRRVPFDWDQRHTLNVTVSLERPEAFSTSAVVRVASGQPFTPASFVGFGFGQDENSGRKPTSMVVDLRGEKHTRLAGLEASLFGRVFNVFDTRFFNGFVFSTSGSPYYSNALFASVDQVVLNDPTRYYGPRRIEVGLTVRPGAPGGSR